MPVCVLDADLITHLETKEQLPELVVLGDRILFEVRYDSRWQACGAKLVEDREFIAKATAEIEGLWTSAEPLASYFAREIAGLPPPSLG
jgi:hypothetical protein